MENRINEKGFTLIELLVVISIIGILASIAQVGVKGLIEKAKIAKAKADLAIIHRGLVLYQLDHDGSFDGVDFRCGGVDTAYPAPGNNVCDDEAWNSGWFSRYIQHVPLDPWGGAYFFDGIPTPGYELDYSDCGPWGTAVYSAGPNRVLDGVNGPGPAGDDLAVFFDNGSVCN